MERRFYGKKEEERVSKAIKRHLIIFFAVLVLGLAPTLALYFLTDRNNALTMEISLCAYFFLYLSSLIFLGLYFLLPLLGRKSFLKSVRNVPLKRVQISSFEPSSFSLWKHEIELVELSCLSLEGKRVFIIEKELLPSLEKAKSLLVTDNLVVGVSEDE